MNAEVQEVHEVHKHWLMRGDITSLCYGLIMQQFHLVTLWEGGPDLTGH